VPIAHFAVDCDTVSAIIAPRGIVREGPRRTDEKTWEDDAGRVYRYSETTNEITLVRSTEPHRAYSPEDFPLNPKVPPEDKSVYEVCDAVLPSAQATPSHGARSTTTSWR